ncbi:iron-containing alcohol dehydrogenase [Silvimonas amylolytica]|uniref:Alcohol dehydrogenase n=1 Tax=Silvimonas amylolytica TaxID=449663 RepID=A0ABQ2PPB2_9NEIS|nr:iron-containing alcohol dehydrogenase [Silvimonas amylolytica]GGP27221.1 alcohol dehydrogenase [Silvimonas amylolytica]
MTPFTFHNPTRLHFGAGQIARLADEIAPGSRVLLVYGGGSIKKNGVYDQIRAALENADITEFAGIEPNPEFDTLMKAVEIGREFKPDWIIAAGGGSVSDGAKFIAAAIALDPAIDPWLIVGNRIKLESAVPLGVVLTLPATGSESNLASVVTRSATQDKLSFKNPLVFPRFAVLDPTVMASLPPRQLGNGVVDAFVHTTEQYLTYPAEARIQDRLAEGILATLAELGPALLDGVHEEARANVMWGANQALFGLVGVGQPQDWATHAIGHELTALYGLDHAQTLAVTLPSLLRHCLDEKEEKLAQYARRVWGLSGEGRELAVAAVEATASFFERMGVPVRLSAHGINPQEAAKKVEEQLIRHGRTALGEHGRLTPADCAAIVAASG